MIFLIDFTINLLIEAEARVLHRRRGWLDLLGSIPTFGVFQFTGLFRLARLSRLARITRLLRGQNRKR